MGMAELLRQVQDGSLPVEEALTRLGAWPIDDLGHTQLDTQREARCGHPEVVFGASKTPRQLVEIARAILGHHERLLVTRVDDEGAAALVSEFSDAQHHADARTIVVDRGPLREPVGQILVVSAGTSDRSVAEEAVVTARTMGAQVDHIPDVGVAGLHRLLAQIERLRAARVLVVVAGMEGALPSVVGGLVKCPVIAVPTSVGYGASFGGVAALLGMLNSCASGVSVVNIDNGFGAGYTAALINRVPERA
ncbi:MAG: NCAIR mutase (PurE)-related protein [Chlamydiales bacterium]|jgi:NCAIR mutase (PurE)-related protein